MATIGATALIGGAIVTGAGFVLGGQLVQSTEGLIKKGIKFVEKEFANKRKNKDGDAPLTNNDDIRDKVTSKERAILNDLIRSTKKVTK